MCIYFTNHLIINIFKIIMHRLGGQTEMTDGEAVNDIKP